MWISIFQNESSITLRHYLSLRRKTLHFFQKNAFVLRGPRFLKLLFFDVSTSSKTSNFFQLFLSPNTILVVASGADHSIFVRIHDVEKMLNFKVQPIDYQFFKNQNVHFTLN